MEELRGSDGGGGLEEVPGCIWSMWGQLRQVSSNECKRLSAAMHNL